MLLNENAVIERGGQRIHLAGIDDADFYKVDNIEKAADTIPHFMWWESVAGLINIQTGYSLTVFSSLAIAEHLMSNDAPPGCWTPAGLMGESFVLSLPGTSKLDLSRPSA